MSEIVFDSAENIYMEGGVSLLKGPLNVLQGTGYVTSKRFVFCKRSALKTGLLGPILMHATKGNLIEFEIDLLKIKSINSVKHGFTKKYILKSTSGDEFAIQFNLNNEKWLSSIQNAVKNLNSNINIKVIGDFIEFSTETIINSKKINFGQNTQFVNQTKKCPDCSVDVAICDNFCTKCGFNFAEFEKQKQDRLSENEKECPECQLILNKEITSCTNCGFPFPLNSIPLIIQEPVIKEFEVKNTISSEPIIDNKKTIAPIIETIKSESTKNEIKPNNIVKKKSNTIYYIVFGVILLLIGLFVFYKMAFAGPSSEQLDAIEKAKLDSIASAQAIAQQRIEDSLNNIGYESEGNSNEAETQPIVNTDEISTKIYKYYEDIQLDRIDAVDYFAPIVNLYITKKNLTPADINNIISKGKEEFSKPEIVLDINNIVKSREENEISYYSFKTHFKCFRTSKQKTQECDVSVEIGINQSNEFVSIKETKIENLIFFDEDTYVPNESLNSSESSAEVFSVVEQMPEFPGGAMEMMNYIQRNIQYPQTAMEAGLSGKCFLKFIVATDGSIRDIQILKGVPGCKECDTEAKRVVSSMPKWKPGKQNGRPVNVFFNLPINFQLR